MVHPLFRNSLSLIIYLLSWIPICLGTIFVVHMNSLTNMSTAIVASIINNGFYAVIGIGLWYVVQYNNFGEKDIVSLVLQHFAIALVIAVLWIVVSNIFVNLASSFFAEGVINTRKFLYSGRLLIGTIYYLVIVMFYYASKYYNESKENKLNQERLLTKLQEAEIKALKAQVNPHFLFNSLNSISMLTLLEPAHAREMLVKLSDYIRYALKQRDLFHSFCYEELDNSKKYLEIEKIRFGDKLLTEFEISEGCNKVKIPVMILQPLYENAVKHGVYESLEPVTIKTKIWSDDEFLYVDIENGFDPEAIPRKGEGIGLKNVADRMRLEYKRTDLFSYRKNENTFIVELKIPINTP